MWSVVANVRSGNATVTPRARSMSNACGVVTSWSRCSPMKSCVCPVGSRRTVWRSQTFWRSVLPMRKPLYQIGDASRVCVPRRAASEITG